MIKYPTVKSIILDLENKISEYRNVIKALKRVYATSVDEVEEELRDVQAEVKRTVSKAAQEMSLDAGIMAVFDKFPGEDFNATRVVNYLKKLGFKNALKQSVLASMSKHMKAGRLIRVDKGVYKKGSAE